MNLLDEYSNDKLKEFEILKGQAIMKKDLLSEKDLLIILDKVFMAGHYVGHCRGEKHVKEMQRQRGW